MEPEGGAARRVVASVHDVAPSHLADVRWLLARLDDIGVGRRVVKVIPDEDGTGDLRARPEIAELPAAESARGAEIVLHGLTHRRSGRPLGGRPLGGRPLRGLTLGGRPLDRLRARLFAAEFSRAASTRDRSGWACCASSPDGRSGTSGSGESARTDLARARGVAGAPGAPACSGRTRRPKS